MVETNKILIIIAIVLPLILSSSCSEASQSNCGATGAACQYYSWQNGTCIAPKSCPTSPTFTVWSNSSFNCVACPSADSSSCVSCSTYNYYYDTNQNICTTCSVNYGSLCLECDSSMCISCAAGYTLSSDKQSCFNGTCSIPYCITCANSLACAVCDDTRQVYNGNCVCAISNCEICSGGYCYSCFAGYTLDSSRLKCNFICISNCDVCTDLNSCTTCSLGYYYESSINECLVNCTTIDSNCISCQTTTICDSCSSNYTLDLSGTSCNTKCSDSNCVTCSKTNINFCTQCLIGYSSQLNSTANTSTCITAICSIPYCQTCASTATCSQCFDLYKLSTDLSSCTPSCNIPNCRSCSSTTTCSTCNQGYKIVSNACSPICSISNCQLCKSSSSCLTCIGGFILSSNSQSCQYNCEILDCISCNSSTTCALCYTGYTLNSAGTFCIVNCQDGFYLNTLNSCQTCPTDNCQKCDLIGKCLTCNSLYFLNNTDFNCISCSTISNCYSCNSGSSSCVVCNNGYYLVNNTCISQITCTVPNCQACTADSTTSCLVCKDGYSLSNNGASCVQIVCTGNQFLSRSTCTCGPKSYFSSGLCKKCNDINCLSCTSSSCSSCKLGYYPSENTCIACSQNCQICDSTGCSTCNDDFIKKNSACVSRTSRKASSVARTGDYINCQTGCQTCDLDSHNNVVCRAAATGYVLKRGKIYKCSQSCLKCQDTADSSGVYSRCQTCSNGYQYSAGTCSKCTDTNALTCSENTPSYSRTCKPGYNAESGVCQACSDNCIKCSSTKSGNCDVGGCLTGYFQSTRFYSCVKCFNGCLVCASNPNICNKCGDYHYILNNQCYSCISNCLTCTTGSSCQTCNTGYLLAADGTCKIATINNCVVYDLNINCITCDYNYDITNGACVLNMICNSTNTCISCKYNYYFSNGGCYNCPIISNCNSCDESNSAACIDCVTGYYLSAGLCQQCPQTGCATCTSSTVCKDPQSGYFLVVDITGAKTGDVSACGGYCLTCTQSTLNCLSCQSGSFLRGNQCLSNNYHEIQYVGYLNIYGKDSTESADIQVGSAINILPRFLTEFARILGYQNFKQYSKNSITTSLKYSSVALQSVLNSESITNDPSTTLASATFTDLSLVSLTVAVTNSSSSSTVNLGLVLGVSIPLGILLIIIIIILKIKSAKNDDQSGLDGTEKDIEYQGQQF